MDSLIVCAAIGGMTGNVRRISKSHTEECQVQAFFSRIVCADYVGMTGRLNKNAYSTIDLSARSSAQMGIDMKIISTVLGAVIIFLLYYGAVGSLDGKLSLQLTKGKVFFADNIITDKFVLGVGVLTFAAWFCLGIKEGSYLSIFQIVMNMTIVLAMSIFSVTDAKVKRIPNPMVLAFLGIWSVIVFAAVIADFEGGLALTGQSMIGGAVGGLIFLLCYFISRGQLGAGDVKLAFVMGLYLTGQRIVGAIAYGVLVCCVYSLWQMARKKLTIKDGVPLAPFLYLGTLITFAIL